MTTVGIRALRDGLSRHLESVREGRTITITDHGKPVARIVPVDAPTNLERMIADGAVTPAHTKGTLPPAIRADGIASDLVGEQRK